MGMGTVAASLYRKLLQANSVSHLRLKVRGSGKEPPEASECLQSEVIWGLLSASSSSPSQLRLQYRSPPAHAQTCLQTKAETAFALSIPDW